MPGFLLLVLSLFEKKERPFSFMLVLWVLRDDCMEEVRPGTGREAGLGHAGGGAATAGALGDAWSNCREDQDCGI
jgi:hypothetical protein